MEETRLRVLGHAVRPLERVQQAGQLFGFERSTSYRMAERDAWPMVGPSSSRWVLMIPLLERYGIPYEVEGSEAEPVSAACGISAQSGEGVQ